MNQITLPATELKQALSGLNKVVSRKSTLPVLSSIKLSRNEAGVVTLSATDLDTFVTYNVEQSQPGKPLEVLLPFEQLNKSIKGSSGDVVVTQETKDRAKVRYQIGDSSLEQSVATLKPDEFPPIPKITASACKMPDNFGEALRQAFEISSSDSSRYVLQGAYIDVQEPKCHTIVSTNGRALFAANTYKFNLKESVNISKQKFLAWSGFLDGECEMTVQADKNKAGWVQLTTPRWNCVVKQIDGQFPKWRQVVPENTETWTRVQLSEAAVAQIINLASKLPGGDDINHTIQLRVSKELHLEGKGKEDKDFTSAVITGVNITGKPITTALNREYLQTALNCGLNEIRISSELEPLVFCNPGKKMVVMPVRLSGTSTEAPQPTPSTQSTETEESTNKERTDMPRTAAATETKAESNASESSVKAVVQQIERIKETLKGVINEFGDVLANLKQVEKEKKANDREIQSVRESLQEIQRIKI